LNLRSPVNILRLWNLVCLWCLRVRFFCAPGLSASPRACRLPAPLSALCAGLCDKASCSSPKVPGPVCNQGLRFFVVPYSWSGSCLPLDFLPSRDFSELAQSRYCRIDAGPDPGSPALHAIRFSLPDKICSPVACFSCSCALSSSRSSRQH
jgi:hypothetical protein